MAFIFPAIVLAQTEVDVIAEHLANPTLRKYFHKMAYAIAQDIILSEPAVGESNESYLRRVAGARGRLEAFNTLLSISEGTAPSVV